MPNKIISSTLNTQSQKLLAIQLATQLPKDPTQALAVISYAKWLVENFLTDENTAGVESKPGLSIIRRDIDSTHGIARFQNHQSDKIIQGG